MVDFKETELKTLINNKLFKCFYLFFASRLIDVRCFFCKHFFIKFPF